MDTHQFTIEFVQYLPADHFSSSVPFQRNFSVDEKGVSFGKYHLSRSDIIQTYKLIRLIRDFDKKAIALQRTGKLGTYPSVLGQEAIGLAIGQLMQTDDIFIPYYRDIATQFQRGVSLKEILLYWGGSELGSRFSNSPHDFPICVPIATQLSHAAGAASALKIRHQHQAALVTCGEGASSKGDFFETLNVAGAWNLPLVVVVNNNQWAISTPRKIQCGAETIAQKGIGAGIHGVVVDGNDYFALYAEIDKALKKARSGKGATLIEAQSYRLGDHTTADDASRYRSSQELDEAWKKEPVLRLYNLLTQYFAWTDHDEKQLEQENSTFINSEVMAYLETPSEPPQSMLEHLYEIMPSCIKDQYAELIAEDLLANARSISTRH